MRRCAEQLYDYAAGYALLCWICERPVFVRPPRFTWLFELYISDGDELEQYLSSHRLNYSRVRIGRGDNTNTPAWSKECFSEIPEFSRERDIKTD